MASILLVDDEPDIIAVLEMVLKDEGMDVFKASTGSEALQQLRRYAIDLVISDIRMPDLTGVELLKEAKNLRPETLFVLITAYASTETAIEALQHGAYDYLTKPFKMDELVSLVRQALASRKPHPVEAALGSQLEAQQSQSLFQALNRNQIVGKSRKMLEVYRMIGTIAAGESTVLVTGESGTGKELVARAIHDASPRRNEPFVSINCGAFPETLLESELFGYMKGAFTGAAGNKMGLFESANGGSIFLDEIGEMTPPMQVKLLRVLQERRLRPLGGTSEVPVDVRVIAATNRDLHAAILQGSFREDLYYRVAVITLRVPSLRERVEDIGQLALHFLRHYATKAGKRVTGVSREALEALESYAWPGNVRELENTIERAVALETTESIQAHRLPENLVQSPAPLNEDSIAVPKPPFNLEEFLARLEKNLICRVLEEAHGNQTAAAEQLGLTKPSLRHKIQVLGIDPTAFRRSRALSR